MIAKLSTWVLVALAMALPFAAAAEGTTVIGYCDGEVAKTSTIGDNHGSDHIEAASLFPSSMFESFEDLEIVGLNVGLSSRLNIADVTVWVRETLDGENLFEASLTKEEGIVKGWNRLAGNPLSLEEYRDLYVGYTLGLSGASFPVSAVGTSQTGGLYVNTDGEWKDMSEEGLGVLSVELVVSASNLVQYDLALRQVALPDNIRIGSTVPLCVKVFNAGASEVNGFGLECEVEGYEPVVFDIEEVILPNTYLDLTLDFICPVDVKSSEVPMCVRIKNIKDGQDANSSNDAMDVTFSMTRFDFKKILLMEEFSTEKCSFCPRGAAVLHDLINEPGNEGRILAVVHHAGFGTDWLTVPASNNYLWFYDGGKGSTYAPAFMYDRYPFDGITPVSNATEDYSSVKQKAAERLALTPMTALEINAEYDVESSDLNIHIEGERVEGYDGDRLTVYVVENEIAAKMQAGTSSPFTHQHALRAVNDIWGEQIDWDAENMFSHDVKLRINPTWDKKNLQLIAFISKYDASDFKSCHIDNAGEGKIDWHGAEINAVDQVFVDGEAEYFTLDGLKVTSPDKGLYIVRRGNQVTKEFIR